MQITESAKPQLRVDFDDRGLFREVKVAAASRDTTMRQIVLAAIREWLDRNTAQAPTPAA